MTSSPQKTTSMARRVAAATIVGTTIEWYDFFIYGTAAALVFAPQFFAGVDPTIALVAAFATFAVGFLARPLGGIVMGHFGDRIGRKSTLIASMVMMGGATVLVGLLPTYETIGVLAPILLVVLRLIQGFGVGGEWGGAVLMAVEHAPAHRRGLYGSFPQMGLPLGVVLSNLVFAGLLAVISPEAFAAWGWRIPFLIGFLLVVVGFVIRLRITESPEFRALESNKRVEKSPINMVLRSHKKVTLIGIGVSFLAPLLGYFSTVYMLSYGTAVLDLPPATMTLVITAAALAWVVAVPIAGALCDRFSRVRLFAVGSVLTVVWAFPFFALVNTGQPGLIAIALAVSVIGLALVSAPVSAMLASLFPTAIRFSGISIAFQIGAILGGAFAPIIATALFAATGSSTALSLYIALAGVLSLIAVLVGRRSLTPSDSVNSTLG